MKTKIELPKAKAHFTAGYIISPTNPLTVNLIGAGGTGSRVLTVLAELNHALTSLGHAGLQVSVFDDDVVAEPNLGRQRFAQSELGLKKCVARVNNINRWFGTCWKAVPYIFNRKNIHRFKDGGSANIFITCVDTVAARFEIASILETLIETKITDRNRPYYWMDFGNSKSTGQVILSTVGRIPQPESKKFSPIAVLPFITDEFKDLLMQSETQDDTPSCSLAEALEKQGLFINPSLAQLGGAMLERLIRNPVTENRGLFLNLETLQTQPLKVA